MKAEEWRVIPGHPDHEVSDLGRVRSWRPTNRNGCRPESPHVLTPDVVHGYQQVELRNGSQRLRKKVHRLVLEAFVGPCPEGMEVRHFPDRSKSNNRLTNLSYGTRQENAADKVVHGTVATGIKNGAYTQPQRRSRVCGSRNGTAKLCEGSVRVIKMLLAEPQILQREIAAVFGVSQSIVSDIKIGQNWRHV